MALVLALLASALSAPLPPPRPADLSRRPQAPPAAVAPPAVATPPVASPAVEPTPDLACAALLADSTIVVRQLPPIAGEGGCGIARPVALENVLVGARRIVVVPGPTMRCDLAAAFASWIAEDLSTLVRSAKADVVGVTTLDAYDCRGRNRQAGAKLSEHAKGNAVDVASVRLSNGAVLALTAAGDQNVSTLLRTSACGRFSTVLGPGSDGFHEDHIHLDLEARRRGGRICEWNLR